MVVGCDNKTGVHQISTFRIPNPFKFTDHNSAKFKQEKERAKKWLVSLKRGFTLDTFHFTKDKIICEEHFEPQMFEEDVLAKLLGCTPSRKRLKPDAIPTLFPYRKEPTKRYLSQQRFSKHEHDQVSSLHRSGSKNSNSYTSLFLSNEI